MIVRCLALTRRPLVSDGMVMEIERLLRGLCPDYLDKILEIEGDEDEKVCVDLQREGFLRAIVRNELERHESMSPMLHAQLGITPAFDRKLGSVYLQSKDEKKSVDFSFDEYALAPRLDTLYMGNSVTLEFEKMTLPGNDFDEVLVNLARLLFQSDLFDYGNICSSDEFEYKNMDRSQGARAVGLDVSKALPGFYWGNYFSQYLIELFGRNTLINLEGLISEPLGSGVFVRNVFSLDKWANQESVDKTKQAIEAIGTQYFFEKGKKMTGSLFTRQDKPH